MVLPDHKLRRQRLLIPALHFVCGFSNGLPDVAKRMMFVNTLQIEPAVQAALFGVLLSVPWQFKLGMAFLTDSVPIGGRRRIPYLLVCLSVQAVVNLCIGLLVGPDLSVGVLAGLLFASTVSQVMIGTILDTLTVENMRNEVGKEVGSLQSNCWIALQLGGLLGLVLGGWAMQYAGLSVAAIYLSVGIVKAVSLLCTFPIYDPKVPASQRDPARCGIKVRVLLSQVWETMKDPVIWKPTVFLFIFAAKPGNADAFNSFLAGKQHNELPPQPLGFSESQIAYIGMFATAANALGAFMYKGCLRQVPLRLLFGTLITFGALVASTQLILIWGLNARLNLPDFWFAIGDDVVIHVVNFMMAMPMLVLMASMCPKGAESTVFALVTSVQTAGSTFSGSLSSMATAYFDVSLRDYSRLWQLTLFTASVKLISLPLLPLIPNAIATDTPRKEKAGDGEEEEADAPDEKAPLLAKPERAASSPPAKRHSVTGAVVLTCLLVGGLSWSIGQATYKLSTGSPPQGVANATAPPRVDGASAGNPDIPTPTLAMSSNNSTTSIRLQEMELRELSAQEIHSRLASERAAAQAQRAAAEQAAAAEHAAELAARAQESAINALPKHIKQLSLAQARNATALAANGSPALLDANRSAAAAAAASAAALKEERKMRSMLMLFAFRRG